MALRLFAARVALAGGRVRTGVAARETSAGGARVRVSAAGLHTSRAAWAESAAHLAAQEHADAGSGAEDAPFQVEEEHARARAEQLFEEGQRRLRARDGRSALPRLLASIDLCTRLEDSDAQLWGKQATAAAAHHMCGQYEEAAEAYAEARKRAAAAGAQKSIAYGKLLVSETDLYIQMRQYDEAERVCKQALRALENSPGTELATAHYNMSAVLGAKAAVALEAEEGSGDISAAVEEARAHVDKAEEIFNSRLGWSSPYSVACVRQRISLHRLEDPHGDVSALEAEAETRSTTPEPRLLRARGAPAPMRKSLAEQWKQTGTLGSCDPRGVVLPRAVLQNELRQFVTAWSKQGLPLDRSLVRALEYEADAIDQCRE